MPRSVSLIGLGVTFAILLLFIVPAILDAVIGNLISLTLTGVPAAVATAATHLTGVGN
jgi:hypothetical protein